MKKLLGSTLALAMFLPTGANAELLKNLKISGQLDVQATSARNVTDFVTRPTQGNVVSNNDRIGDAHTRTMVSADWDLLDDVHARLTLVKGGEGTVANSRVYGEAADSLDNVTATTLVQEANVKIDKLAGLFDTTVGRQFYGEPGDLIIYYGPRDNFGQRVDAIDAFRLDWKGEHLALTGVAGRTTDANVLAAGAAADVDVRGLVLSCSQSEMVKPSIYVYNRVRHGTAALGAEVENTNLFVAGAKAKINAGGLMAHVEFAKNFGEDRTSFVNGGLGPQTGKYTGYALLAKLGYKLELPDVAAVHPWAKFGMGSGDANFAHAGNGNFQSINTDFRPGGLYGRFDNTALVSLGSALTASNSGTVASNGLTNRVIWGVGVKATPAFENKLTAGLAYYRYAFHRVAPRSTGIKPSRNIGSEVNVTAEWKHSDNVMLDATLGSFLPGAHIADLKGAHAALNPAQMAALDLKVKF